MKFIALPVAILTLILNPILSAETVKIPAKKPVVSVTIPDDWNPEATDEGVTCESPDTAITMFFEVTPKKDVDALIDENIKWLTEDQKVEIDNDSQKTKDDIKFGDLTFKRISWDGKSEEFGDALVGFMFADVGGDKLMTLTYWITKKDADANSEVFGVMLESLKKLKK